MSIGSGGHCLSIRLAKQTTRSRVENYSEQRCADGERSGRVCWDATTKLKRVPDQEAQRGPLAHSKFPRSRSHGPLYDDTVVQILQIYFTGLEIQVKVIIQILSALELESKCQRGRVRDDPRGTDHNRSFGVRFVVGLLSLSESEPWRSRKQITKRTKLPAPRGQ